MSKKMHDILPPTLARKIENTLKQLESDSKKKNLKPKRTKTQELAKKTLQRSLGQANNAKRFPLVEILVGGGVIILLLCIWGFLKLPKADIQIWPKMDTLTLSEKITADKSVTAVNLANKVIPAQYVEVTQDSQQSFPATGSASNDGKATGTIKVYNKINPATPFTLKVGTHFLSDSGKYFVTLARITIPAQKGNTPGFINVQVQAEQSGADYNIGPSKFSVPKLNGTSYYYSVWGESTTAMTGGYTGKVKKVTDDDIKNAQDTLTKKLLALAMTSLKSKITSDEVLLDGAMVSTVVSASADVASGAVVDSFNEQAKVKVSAIVFKKQDLQDFIKQDILSKVSGDNDFLENSITLNNAVQSVDMQGGKLNLNLQATVKTYFKINVDNLIDLFSEKSADQIKQVIDQMYEGKISQLKVNFWQFWVTRAPSDENRIKVNLSF